MAAITWSDVTAHAAQLTTAVVPSAARTDILAYVNSVVNVKVIDGEDGPKSKMARIYLAAHFGEVARSQGLLSSGAVTSESAGGLARSYAAILTMDPASLGASRYGQEYTALIRTSGARAPFVIGC